MKATCLEGGRGRYLIMCTVNAYDGGVFISQKLSEFDFVGLNFT